MTDKLKEALSVLKKVKHWIDYGAGELEPTANTVIEAIDTVVEYLENPLPTDEEIESYAIENELSSDSIAGVSEMKAWIDGAIWMRDAHLNTENISELDENLDEKVIEQYGNKECISTNIDKDFPPELLKTYYPFIVEA